MLADRAGAPQCGDGVGRLDGDFGRWLRDGLGVEVGRLESVGVVEEAPGALRLSSVPGGTFALVVDEPNVEGEPARNVVLPAGTVVEVRLSLPVGTRLQLVVPPDGAVVCGLATAG